MKGEGWEGVLPIRKTRKYVPLNLFVIHSHKKWFNLGWIRGEGQHSHTWNAAKTPLDLNFNSGSRVVAEVPNSTNLQKVQKFCKMLGNSKSAGLFLNFSQITSNFFFNFPKISSKCLKNVYELIPKITRIFFKMFAVIRKFFRNISENQQKSLFLAIFQNETTTILTPSTSDGGERERRGWFRFLFWRSLITNPYMWLCIT